MSNDAAKAAAEREAFMEFASVAGLPIVPGTVESRSPPEPDIVCEIEGRGRVAALREPPQGQPRAAGWPRSGTRGQMDVPLRRAHADVVRELLDRPCRGPRSWTSSTG